MSFLLDTNVVSEWTKARPNPGVVAWLAEADEDRIYISVITLAELRHGVARMPAGRRKRRLDQWLRDDLPLRFEGRVLTVDDEVADAWGETVAQHESLGRPIASMDAFIAATAKIHGLTLVTRNTADFEPSLDAILNPWQ
jgi:predicted nucleic acid-binding protein